MHRHGFGISYPTQGLYTSGLVLLDLRPMRHQQRSHRPKNTDVLVGSFPF